VWVNQSGITFTDRIHAPSGMLDDSRLPTYNGDEVTKEVRMPRKAARTQLLWKPKEDRLIYCDVEVPKQAKPKQLR